MMREKCPPVVLLGSPRETKINDSLDPKLPLPVVTLRYLSVLERGLGGPTELATTLSTS